MELILPREVLPDYNKLCQQEGELMLAYIDGNHKAGSELEGRKGQTEKLLDHLWGRRGGLDEKTVF